MVVVKSSSLSISHMCLSISMRSLYKSWHTMVIHFLLSKTLVSACTMWILLYISQRHYSWVGAFFQRQLVISHFKILIFFHSVLLIIRIRIKWEHSAFLGMVKSKLYNTMRLNLVESCSGFSFNLSPNCIDVQQSKNTCNVDSNYSNISEKKKKFPNDLLFLPRSLLNSYIFQNNEQKCLWSKKTGLNSNSDARDFSFGETMYVNPHTLRHTYSY